VLGDTPGTKSDISNLHSLLTIFNVPKNHVLKLENCNEEKTEQLFAQLDEMLSTFAQEAKRVCLISVFTGRGFLFRESQHVLINEVDPNT